MVLLSMISMEVKGPHPDPWLRASGSPDASHRQLELLHTVNSNIIPNSS